MGVAGEGATGHIRREVAVEVESATDVVQDGQVDGEQVGVVVDIDATGNGGQAGEGEVLDIVVGVEGEISDALGLVTNGGEVGSRQRLQEVGVDGQGLIDSGQRRDLERRGVAQDSVHGPLKVGKLDGEGAAIGEDAERANVADLGGDGVQEGVVGDEEGIHAVQVDAVQGGQSGVGDAHAGGLGDRLAEGELVDALETGPVDGVDGGELVELQAGHAGEVAQHEGAGN